MYGTNGLHPMICVPKPINDFWILWVNKYYFFIIEINNIWGSVVLGLTAMSRNRSLYCGCRHSWRLLVRFRVCNITLHTAPTKIEGVKWPWGSGIWWFMLDRNSVENCPICKLSNRNFRNTVLINGHQDCSQGNVWSVVFSSVSVRTPACMANEWVGLTRHMYRD